MWAVCIEIWTSIRLIWLLTLNLTVSPSLSAYNVSWFSVICGCCCFCRRSCHHCAASVIMTNSQNKNPFNVINADSRLNYKSPNYLFKNDFTMYLPCISKSLTTQFHFKFENHSVNWRCCCSFWRCDSTATNHYIPILHYFHFIHNREMLKCEYDFKSISSPVKEQFYKFFDELFTLSSLNFQ